MSRKPRIHFPGAGYHVMLRGNGGRDIFSSSADRSKMFFLLQEGVERFGHRIHAFCLMSNHVHLVIEVGEILLSKIIQNLSFRYTRYVNAINKESGHLFQGRYKAILIDADSYLLQLVRYIHCNPVRAKLNILEDDSDPLMCCGPSHCQSLCSEVQISPIHADRLLKKNPDLKIH